MKLNRQHYESQLLDYLHGELQGDDLQEMENFLAAHPDIAEKYALLQETIIPPDLSIQFPDKQSLLKTESTKSAPLITFRRYLSIAAILIGCMFALFFLLRPHQQERYTSIPHLIAPKQTNLDTDAVAQTPIRMQTKLANKPQRNKLTQKIKKVELITPPSPVLQPAIPEEKYVQTIIQQSPLPAVAIAVEPVQPPLTIVDSKPSTPSVANEVTRGGTLALDNEKQPRLFAWINRLSGMHKKVKETKNQLMNTEMVVMVGNFKLLSLNHF